MKCESCNVQIDERFTHAIQNNQCPACGKKLMQKAKLASYLSLCALLQDNFKDLDVDKISALIVSNFEIKQIFQNNPISVKKESSIEVVEEENDTEYEAAITLDDGIKLEKLPKSQTKKVLQQLRDNALNGAMEERYGIGNGEEGMFMSEDSSIYEEINRAKQETHRDAVISGSRGSFSRTH